jgi:hypothetical protein
MPGTAVSAFVGFGTAPGAGEQRSGTMAAFITWADSTRRQSRRNCTIAQTGLHSEGLWCQLPVVIVYSSTMVEICPELSGSNRTLDPVKHTAAQEVTGMNGGGQDRRFGSPLVAGSGPPAPHQRRPENLPHPPHAQQANRRPSSRPISRSGVVGRPFRAENGVVVALRRRVTLVPRDRPLAGRWSRVRALHCCSRLGEHAD